MDDTQATPLQWLLLAGMAACGIVFFLNLDYRAKHPFTAGQRYRHRVDAWLNLPPCLAGEFPSRSGADDE